jgi:hypothetical protein
LKLYLHRKAKSIIGRTDTSFDRLGYTIHL